MNVILSPSSKTSQMTVSVPLCLEDADFSVLQPEAVCLILIEHKLTSVLWSNSTVSLKETYSNNYLEMKAIGVIFHFEIDSFSGMKQQHQSL